MTKYGILGPIEVVSNGVAVPIRRPQLRGVLAYLLLNAGLVVPVEQLLDALWGETPPANGRTQIHGYVSQIRRTLRGAGSDGALTTRPGGYCLTVAGTDELDLHQFNRQVRQADEATAAGHPDAAAELLSGALALWRGPALAGAAGEFVESAAAGLNARRLSAQENLAAAQLALGQHRAAIALLWPLADANPFRERLVSLLMLALAGSGQQLEALRRYDLLREHLADELGVTPGPDVAATFLRVLRHQVPAAPGGGATPTATGDAAVPEMAAEICAGPPAQLPSDITGFVGRHAQLRRLDAMLAGQDGSRATGVITIIDGSAGIGKTALAVHWAHRAAGRFPDGQLYVNLRGFDPEGQIMPPTDAVYGFLEALGVPPDRIPADVNGRTGLYRSLLWGKQMLIVLDNARDAEQVRPLLPGTATAATIVTSRNQLTPLVAVNGAYPLTLDLLTPEEARELLVSRLGREQVDPRAEAVEQIIAACARLPLALAIAASRAQQTGFTLSEIAAELAKAKRLDVLDAGDAMSEVRAVFSWSYAQLSPAAARLFRLLGLHPGPDITVPAAASLIGCCPSSARRLLAELVRASMLTERRSGRYAIHDLLNEYAAELVDTADDEPVRRAAMTRLLSHFTHTAIAAERLLSPLREQIVVDVPEQVPGVSLQPLADQAEAMEWFAREYPTLARVLRIADAGFDAYVWCLAWTLDTFLDWRGSWEDIAAVWRTALPAARRLGNLAAQASAHRLLAYASTQLGDGDDANRNLERALDLYARAGDVEGQGRAHLCLAVLCFKSGNTDRALDHARQTLALTAATGNRRGQAAALNNLSWYHAALGDSAKAIAYGTAALDVFKRLDDRRGEAAAWDSLGNANSRAGEYDEATRCYRHAIAIYHRLGNKYEEAVTLANLGDACNSARDFAAARSAWQRSFGILNDLCHPRADNVWAKLHNLMRHTADGVRVRHIDLPDSATL